MKPDAFSMRPRMSFLSDEEKRKIHGAALRILEEIGMEIRHEEALHLLKDAGCQVGGGNMVRIPGTVVEEAIRKAPRQIEIFDREARPAMNLGGYRIYFGSGSDLLYTIDIETQQRRLSTVKDVRLAAGLCDSLPNIDFIMSSAHPSDVEPRRAYLCSFQAMAESSRKPLVSTAEGRADLRVMWEIAKTLRGGEAGLRQRPYFIHYAEPISPLRQTFEALDELLFCVEKGIPVIYSPAPIIGSTSPITIAGHVAQGLAESLCGLVIAQLKREGAPVVFGLGPSSLDMVTGECSYNAPEIYLAYLADIEMCHFYDLPSWGIAGTSDSQIPDGQACFEGGLLTFLSGMAGANLNHDVGYLDFGKTGSLEMMVIIDEFIAQTKRLLQGIPVSEETLALPVIESVGPGGHFLTADHTLAHLRETQWRPGLISRDGYDEWKASGSLSIEQRARERVLGILKKRESVPIEREIASRIDRLVEEY
ncbi:MAG: trimethylamine methyltransferase family protein [Deltaproteobacteria bacterium]|nr:trimethylamine methyltransferase family protein [Deltaproteobacteria bacterium]